MSKSVPVRSGTAIVFDNLKAYHRMTALRTASEEGGRRSVIGFFVVREGLYREAPTSEVTSDSLTVNYGDKARSMLRQAIGAEKLPRHIFLQIERCLSGGSSHTQERFRSSQTLGLSGVGAVVAAKANGSIMNLRSHSTRGWCLLEMMAANLLDKPILAATGPKSIFQSVTKARMHKLPHKGQLRDSRLGQLGSLLRRSLESFWKRYQLGASVTTANLYGLSPLMLACVEGNLSEVQLLLEAKAEVNESRHTVMGSETTALCVATMSSPPVVRSLLDAKADTQVGHPMSWAVQYLNLEILSLLPEELHREKSGSGDSPINLAVQAQCTSTVDVLLQMGADPTALATTSRCSVQFSRPRRKRKSQKIARSLEAASEASNMPQARWWRRANRTSRSTTGSTEESAAGGSRA
eukprot:g3238.t1